MDRATAERIVDGILSGRRETKPGEREALIKILTVPTAPRELMASLDKI